VGRGSTQAGKMAVAAFVARVFSVTELPVPPWRIEVQCSGSWICQLLIADLSQQFKFHFPLKVIEERGPLLL
jgi:hypothetical protein